MTIRDSFSRGLPPWLLRRVAGRLLWSVGLILDTKNELTRQGVKARMPGVGTPTALPAIGDDRLIDRGPEEPEDNYALRLSSAFDTWRSAGNAIRLLENLRAYFLPNPLPLRLVSDRSVWHQIDQTTGIVTRQKGDDLGADNWHWDPFAAGSPPFRWWRGWVIIDASAMWTQWLVGELPIGSGVIVGDGHTVGSTATPEQVASIRRIVRRFKPAHAHVYSIIVTFVDGLFSQHKQLTDAPMPNGNYHRLENRSTDAIYWQGASTP